jgi:uncharacterized membrane protein YeaQ/YmgE (transglycosylase-associated protein family)
MRRLIAPTFAPFHLRGGLLSMQVSAHDTDATAKTPESPLPTAKIRSQRSFSAGRRATRIDAAARSIQALFCQESAMGIIGWILFGLVVGVIARFLMPGPQPMGIILTILLGVAGSFTGGYLASLIQGVPADGSHAAGWIGSILGALLLLFLYGLMKKKSA